jgi:large conductance mechanosensitive channel
MMKKIDAKELKNESKKKAKLAFEDYKAFALKGNALDLAIGVVLGGAFTTIVNTLVSALITPIISLLTSNADFSNLFITLKGGKFDTLEAAKAAGAVTLNYGEILTAIINFIIISIVLFLIVKAITKANKKDSQEVEVTTKTCPYCLSTIPIKATKCAHCTSDLEEDK